MCIFSRRDWPSHGLDHKLPPMAATSCCQPWPKEAPGRLVSPQVPHRTQLLLEYLGFGSYMEGLLFHLTIFSLHHSQAVIIPSSFHCSAASSQEKFWRRGKPILPAVHHSTAGALLSRIARDSCALIDPLDPYISLGLHGSSEKCARYYLQKPVEAKPHNTEGGEF